MLNKRKGDYMNFLNQSKNPHQFQNLSTQDKQLSMLLWILALFTNFVGPLILWVMKKDESEYLNQQGKNYFNYAISYAIYAAVSFVLMAILIGYVTTFVLTVVCTVYTILGIITTNKGEDYVVPFTIEFIK